jgi:hypothetical protein
MENTLIAPFSTDQLPFLWHFATSDQLRRAGECAAPPRLLDLLGWHCSPLLVPHPFPAWAPHRQQWGLSCFWPWLLGVCSLLGKEQPGPKQQCLGTRARSRARIS